MTWTYGCDPENSDLDAVRLIVGDTDTNDQLLKDEEINYFLDIEGSVRLASARAAEAVAAKFSRLVDETVGRVRVSFSQKAKQYKELAESLLETYNECAGVPFAGGISISSKDSTRDNGDRVRPSFTRSTHENPRNPDNFEDEDCSRGQGNC